MNKRQKKIEECRMKGHDRKLSVNKKKGILIVTCKRCGDRETHPW